MGAPPVNPPEQRASAPADVVAVPPTSPFVGLRTDGHRPSSARLFLPLSSQDQFRWATSLAATEAAGPNARLRARPWLTTAQWTGNVERAARVADKLVDNAFRHGATFPDGLTPVRMIVLRETNELIIEADDASPDFPNFSDVANRSGEPKGMPTGLWWVAYYCAHLSWVAKRHAAGAVVGKTVRAVLPPSWMLSS